MKFLWACIFYLHRKCIIHEIIGGCLVQLPFNFLKTSPYIFSHIFSFLNKMCAYMMHIENLASFNPHSNPVGFCHSLVALVSFCYAQINNFLLAWSIYHILSSHSPLNPIFKFQLFLVLHCKHLMGICIALQGDMWISTSQPTSTVLSILSVFLFVCHICVLGLKHSL